MEPMVTFERLLIIKEGLSVLNLVHNSHFCLKVMLLIYMIVWHPSYHLSNLQSYCEPFTKKGKQFQKLPTISTSRLLKDLESWLVKKEKIEGKEKVIPFLTLVYGQFKNQD